MESEPTPPLRVAQITDTHLYTEPGGYLGNVDVDRSLEAVIRALADDPGWQPDLVVLTGDLVQQETGAAYQRLHAMLAALPVPCFCLPGNHDDKALQKRVCQSGSLQWREVAELGGWQLLFIDSVRPGAAGGHVSVAELERLRALIGERGDCHRLALMHHQPVPIGSPWLDTMMIDNANALFSVLDSDPCLKGLVFGHVHQTFVGRRRGLPIWGTPSTCLQFSPGDAREAFDPIPPGYRWLDLYPDGRLLSGVRRVVAPASIRAANRPLEEGINVTEDAHAQAPVR
jgi:Icc protein